MLSRTCVSSCWGIHAMEALELAVCIEAVEETGVRLINFPSCFRPGLVKVGRRAFDKTPRGNKTLCSDSPVSSSYFSDEAGEG